MHNPDELLTISKECGFRGHARKSQFIAVEAHFSERILSKDKILFTQNGRTAQYETPSEGRWAPAIPICMKLDSKFQPIVFGFGSDFSVSAASGNQKA